MSAPSLDNRRFRDVTPQHAGDVGDGTVFEYHQDDDGTVWARYSGGRVRRGYLVGTRQGDQLDFRYSHVTAAGATASGHCVSSVVALDDGRLQMRETWEWESRPGSGSSILEEIREPAAPDAPAVTVDQLRLATRNHGMPLEALRYDVTPVGLHYLLIHYDIPDIDPARWRLHVGGRVERPLELGLDDLRRRPTVTRRVTMECAGNGRARLTPRVLSQPWLHEAVGTGEWTGTPVIDLLEDAGVHDAGTEVVFTGADRGLEGGIDQAYARSIDLDELRAGGALLAWELNGVPLPPQHGAPVRLVVPGWYGMTSVKWLTHLEVVDAPFDGYQQAHAYRWRDRPGDAGQPLARMAVRSLVQPPGVPEFFTRRRVVERGVHELVGRAWSGHGAITSVETSVDGGRSWQAAALEPDTDPAAWTQWRATWRADRPGDVEVCCRATDEAGHTQAAEPVWNVGGYAVNAVHRVPVTVR